MQESLREFQEQKLANEREAMNVDMECLDIESLQDSGPSDLSRKKKKMGIASYFPSDVKIGSQPTIKAALQSKERWHEVDLAIARFFYDACVPINVGNSFYFQPMIDAIACIGLGYKGPTYHALRTNLLEESKKEFQLLVNT